MNLKLLLPGFVLMTCSAAFSQEKTRVDWQKLSESINETQITKPVQFGKFATFEISNINLFLFKVEISGKSVELQTPVPTELQTLFRLTNTELSKATEIKKAEEGVEAISEAIPPMNKIAKDVEAKKDSVPSTDTTGKGEKLEEFQVTMDELVKKCLAYFELSKTLSKDIFELKQTRFSLINIAKLDTRYEDIQGKVNPLTIRAETIKTHYLDFKSLYEEVESLYDQAKAESEDLSTINKTQKKQIEKSSNAIEKGYNLINEESLLALLSDVEFLRLELQNPKNFTAVAPPIQMEDDFVTYIVKVTPTLTGSYGPFKSPKSFKFDVPTRGGLKVDFSVGPVVSFGKGSRDFRYYKGTPNPASGDFELMQRDNRNDISPSLAAFMHFYPRSGRPSALGGLLGVGAGFQAISDVNLSLFTGLTSVLGKKQKVMLSGGLSYLRVDRLKRDQYRVGGVYSSDVSLSDVTEKVFKASPFLSITYNLASRIEN